jgi:hypothetical protein
MEISGTCNIEVYGENRNPITPETLRKIENALTEKLSEVIDELFYSYGLANEQMHSGLVSDLEIIEQ